MRAPSLLLAVGFAVLLVVQEGSAGSCGCSSKKALPARNCGEDDVAYYKRIFAVEKTTCGCAVKKLYEKVFYEYKGESKESYVKRIDTIFSKVHQKLDCRCDSSKTDFLKTYYKYKFSKKSSESDEQYFQRVLTKKSESESVYKSKVELIQKFVKADWSKVTISAKSSTGFSLVKKSSSTSKSCGCQKSKKKEVKKKVEKKVKKEKKVEKKVVKKEKSCGCQKKSQEKKVKKVEEKKKSEKKVSKEKKEEKKVKKSCGCQKKAHEKNVKKIEVQKKEHTKNVKKVEEQKKTHEKNVKKINAQKCEHSKNVKKVEQQKKEHEMNVKKVEQQKKENEINVKKVEQQKKEHEINVKKVEQQKREHEINVKKVEEQKIQHETNVKKAEEQKRVHEENVKKVEAQKSTHAENVRIIEERKKTREENVKKWIKAHYCRQKGEEISTYYNRLFTKTESSSEEYFKRISTERSLFSTLDLWYSEEYLSLTREYYSYVYSKKTTETEEEYFKRLVTKESYETEENCAKRINVLRVLYPSLALWYDEKYYSYASSFYKSFYKKLESESSEVYLKRVFTKCSAESEENFWKRVKIIQNTFPSYKCWYEKENLQKLEVFKSFSKVTSAEELKQQIKSEKVEKQESDALCKAKTETLQTFFKSSKSYSSESSSESKVVTSSSAGCASG